MLAKQLDDALCSGDIGDWRGRGGKCVSCQAPIGGTNTATAVSPMNGTESQPLSLLAELKQAEAASSHVTSAPSEGQMVDVDLTTTHWFENRPAADVGQPNVDVEQWATRLCDELEQQRHSGAGSRLLELSVDTRYRLLKLIGSSAVDDSTLGTSGRPANATDLAELVRNRDSRVAELTCEVSYYYRNTTNSRNSNHYNPEKLTILDNYHHIQQS